LGGNLFYYNNCGRKPDSLWVRMNAAQSFKRIYLEKYLGLYAGD
jgi:hypothetical protein